MLIVLIPKGGSNSNLIIIFSYSVHLAIILLLQMPNLEFYLKMLYFSNTQYCSILIKIPQFLMSTTLVHTVIAYIRLDYPSSTFSIHQLHLFIQYVEYSYYQDRSMIHHLKCLLLLEIRNSIFITYKTHPIFAILTNITRMDLFFLYDRPQMINEMLLILTFKREPLKLVILKIFMALKRFFMVIKLAKLVLVNLMESSM